MDFVAAGFDWDQGNRLKCTVHGVSIAEIEEIFRGEPRVAPDLAHSRVEDRLVAIGNTALGPPVFVIFTLREQDGRRLIRPISARYMHAREIRRHGSTSA